MAVNKNIKLVAGYKYTINTSFEKSIEIYVDYILDHKKYTHWSNTLIVYRYLNYNQEWIYKIDPFYTLAIFNDWKYKD